MFLRQVIKVPALFNGLQAAICLGCYCTALFSINHTEIRKTYYLTDEHPCSSMLRAILTTEEHCSFRFWVGAEK